MKVKELRQKLDLTQNEFALKLGVDYHTIMRWEKGHTKPSGMANRLLELIEKELNGKRDK